MAMNREKIADRLEALGNSTRLEIFRYLVQCGDHGISVGDIQKKIGIPASTLSHHIARLNQVGLISQERQSRTLICKPLYKHMDEVVEFLTKKCCSEKK
jgi:ArsR family transcriptional regulator, arsenate/arsenite/antimonite-responsive transcriptional repressor